MKEKSFLRLMQTFWRLPGSIRIQVASHLLKRATGLSPLRHEIIWASFFYFAAESNLLVKEQKQYYKVILNLQEPITIYLRKTPSSDVFVFFQVFISREYQPLIEFLKLHNIEPMTIIDAGANVGYFSLLMSSQFPEARVLSVEPAQSNFALLSQNLHWTTSRVKGVLGALWTSEEPLQLADASAEEWSHSVLAATDRSIQECRGITLKLLRERLGVARIELLKMDIEGAEAILFRDSEFLLELRQVNVLAMEIHDKVANRIEIESVLAALGFEYFRSGELTIAYQRNR